MSEFICNTSPLQYLHQLGLLDILPNLTGGVIVPPAVVGELHAGRSTGYNVPDPTQFARVKNPSVHPANAASASLAEC